MHTDTLIQKLLLPMTASGHFNVIFQLSYTPQVEAGRFILRIQGGVRYPKPPKFTYSIIIIVTHRNAR